MANSEINFTTQTQRHKGMSKEEDFSDIYDLFKVQF